ncbi:HAD family hydrolase [Chimaeribacter arupi]|uniref:HAD family hydrolase n=1 Tax=Chimaeribacter arupi TaxID=2060066 RepID=UPI002946DA6E|nr:HAD-IA family hydrolase [Chimaeribacter arupi]MDV5141012.1 HAD-IA family hydrolase [Chimaeribacter arupi]
MKKMIVTDLDNTLYDWVSFYAQSFDAMLTKLEGVLEVSRDELIQDFKKIHVKHGNSEYPFAALQLDCVKRKLPASTSEERARYLDEAFHSFNSTRKKSLTCYPGVHDTLYKLREMGVVIVGHTEAPIRNAIFRLEKLDLIKYMKHLYSPQDRYYEELNESSKNWIESYGDFIFKLDEEERKPNPKLLLDICAREGVDPRDALYVGDSLVKDIAMANKAGVDSVFASYGKQHEKKYWDILVSITHWSESDVVRESKLKEAYAHEKPAFTIDNFSELLDII